MEFNEIVWHDAVIKQININRTNPGNDDSIFFEIDWPNDNKKAVLVFEEVYWASMNLNFGIVAEETIMDAVQIFGKSEELKRFYSLWKGLMNDLELNTFKIRLNSTGGEITLIAKKFSLNIH